MRLGVAGADAVGWAICKHVQQKLRGCTEHKACSLLWKHYHVNHPARVGRPVA